MAANYSPPKAVINPYVYIAGTESDDTIFGTDNNDEMHGGGGQDNLFGGAGNDLIFGENGNDILWGEAGNDILDGGIGNDTMVGGAGADIFRGGADFDTVSYASSSLGVSIDMVSGAGTNDAAGDTFNSVEKLVGSNYGDVFRGNTFAQTFDGGAGDDWLFGQGGEDTLVGGLGDDHLDGGWGADTLIGGDGIDTLTGGSDPDVFAVSVFAGADHITDFEKGVDRIVFTDLKLKQPFGADGVLETMFGQVGSAIIGGSSNDCPDTIVWDPNDHTLYQVDWSWDGDDAWVVTRSQALLHIDNNVQLAATDFLL